MDGELIRSVVPTGAPVEVTLADGRTMDGRLESLSESGLVLRSAAGAPLVVALSAVTTLRPLNAPPPRPASAPAPAHSAPAPAQDVPAPEPRGAPSPDPDDPANFGPREASSSGTALDAIAHLPLLPVELDGIQIAPENRDAWDEVCAAVLDVERSRDPDQRRKRAVKAHSRARYLLERAPAPGLDRLVGQLAALTGDFHTGRAHVKTAAELGGDLPAWRLLAIASARVGDEETAVVALLRFFQKARPPDHSETWEALLTCLDAHARRGWLTLVLESGDHDAPAREAVRIALSGVPPDGPPPPDLRHGEDPDGPNAAGADPYERAKLLERGKDFDAAKAAYREAIARGGTRTESSVKDLASLTGRTDGPRAALRVIEDEYPGLIRPGDALDNIMIALLTKAERLPEALERLERQAGRPGLHDGRRYELLLGIARAKLALRRTDAIAAWEALLELRAGDRTAQKGLAVAHIHCAGPGDLERAEDLAHDLPAAQNQTLFRRIDLLRQGDPDGPGRLEGPGEAEKGPPPAVAEPAGAWLERMLSPGGILGDSAPPLVAYVIRKYSMWSDDPLAGPDRRRQPATGEELAAMVESATRARATGDERGRIQAYVSASVLARELGDPDAQRYLFLGLSALAGQCRDQGLHESARDLFCAALATADERHDDARDTDIRATVTEYLRSRSGGATGRPQRAGDDEPGPPPADAGKALADVLEEEYQRRGATVFDLLPPLITDTELARDLVLEALAVHRSLLEAAAAYLRAGVNADSASWQLVAKRWVADRRRFERVRDEILTADPEDQGLESARIRFADLINTSPATLHPALTKLATCAHQLALTDRQTTFEERENCLRQAGLAVEDALAEISPGPTRLAVTLVEPVAAHLRKVVDQARVRLLTEHAPRPELTMVIEQIGPGPGGGVTVQIKVSNAPGTAPIEAADLLVDNVPGICSVAERHVQLPVVRGGDHHIQLVKLRVMERGLGSGAFSLPVTLRYRPRGGASVAQSQAGLPVRLTAPEDFQPVPNAFHIGATGTLVQDPAMFYGRDDLIDRIRSQLRDAPTPGVGVAVYGPKRAGKSSIRYHLTRRLRELDGLPVVDIGSIGMLTPDRDDAHGTPPQAVLMWRILAGAHKALLELDPEDTHGAGPLIPDGLTKEEFLSGPEPVYDCADLIRRHRDRHTGRPPTLTVLIDEFHYVGQWIRQGLLPASFTHALKALLERQVFHLVIVGQDALGRMIREDPDVFGSFTAERVTHLEEGAARDLIERPIIRVLDGGREVSRFRERAVDRIVELTGGSPFYIQRFCRQLVEYMNAERVPSVTEADVQRVYDALLGQLEAADFDSLESPGHTDPDAATATDYRAVLLAVARASRDRPASVRAINAEYGGDHLLDRLGDLELRDVVRRVDDRFRITVGLYQGWLLRRFGAGSSSAAAPRPARVPRSRPAPAIAVPSSRGEEAPGPLPPAAAPQVPYAAATFAAVPAAHSEHATLGTVLPMNPYSQPGRVAEGEEFIGRDGLVREVHRFWLDSQRPANLRIIGHHRTGKTSLARRALDSLPDSRHDLIPVWIDLGTYQSGHEVFRAMAKTILRSLRGTATAAPAGLIDEVRPIADAVVNAEEWYDVRETVHDFFQLLHQARQYVLLILDEFDRAPSVFRELAEFQLLRTLVSDSRYTVGVTTLSRRDIEPIERNAVGDATLGPVVPNSCFVGMFSDAETDLMLARAARVDVRLAGVKPDVLSRSGAHPFLLELLCQQLVTVQHTTGRIDPEFAYAQVFALFAGQFDTLIRNIDADSDGRGSPILRAVANGKPATGPSELISRLRDTGVLSHRHGRDTLFSQAFAHHLRTQ